MSTYPLLFLVLRPQPPKLIILLRPPLDLRAGVDGRHDLLVVHAGLGHIPLRLLVIQPLQHNPYRLLLAPTATPQPIAGDPVAQLGEPDFLEDFSAAGGWPYEDDWFLITVSGGQLHAYSKGTPYWSSWYTTYPEVKDAYFETTITRPNCNGQDRFGLVIRWDESQEFYYMGVTCDSTWGFSFYTEDNQIINILDYQSNNAFKPADEANRIGIMAKGDQFDFYINGTKVGSVTDDRLPDAGTFGFLSMSAGTVNLKTSVDVLEYWEQ